MSGGDADEEAPVETPNDDGSVGENRPKTTGIHHVSTVARDPFGNLQFYAEVLGLRLTKRTVNFDEPAVYHLYYGDREGTPGTTFTCFPYPLDSGGRVGKGQPTEVAFAVPEGSLDAWRDRLADHGVDADTGVSTRFGERALTFRDPDGLPLSLVESSEAGVVGRDERSVESWTDREVPESEGIRGVHSVTLTSANVFVTARVLEVLGFGLVGQEGDRVRYVAGAPIDGDESEHAPAPATPGTAVDLLDREAEWGKEGAGTGHHVAFRVPDREALDQWYERLVDAGLSPSRPTDRYYFESVYARDPGGVLFELATDGPGLTRDESVEELGSALRLPPWLADDEATIREQLPPLDRPVERRQRTDAVPGVER